MNHELLVVLGTGGSECQRIARQARDMGVYTEVLSDDTPLDELKAKNPKGIIASGVSGIGVPIFELPLSDEPSGLKKFLFDTCGFKGDWKMEIFAENKINELKEKLSGKKVLLALSGGVDSSVCAAMIYKAIGKELTCIFVDHGLMRLHESDEVESIFKDRFDINLIKIDAESRF